MKYEAPELTALTPAINAIQAAKQTNTPSDGGGTPPNEPMGAYADWED
jgi:hypothetical protein